MDDIKVSIITICRNSAQDISKTLRSVLNQSQLVFLFDVRRTSKSLNLIKRRFKKKGILIG